MVEKNTDKKVIISGGAIILGALIGIAFLIVLGALAGALKMSFAPAETHLPSKNMLGLMVVVATILLTFAFFIAGLVASKVAHQYLCFDSVMHSLGAWALMSILIIILVSLTAAANSIRSLESPLLITDIHLSEPNAVTRITTEHKKKPKTKNEIEGDKLMALLWWVAFFSLACGSVASVMGGKLVRKS